jgi:putative membrane protein
MKIYKGSTLAALLAAAALVGTSTVWAQESTTYAPDPNDPSGEETRTQRPEDDTSPRPGKVGSMAPVGIKPSKAELEKQKQQQQQGSGNTTATTGAKPGTSGAAATQLPDQDRRFVQLALQDGLHEVHMGQMAMQHGQSDQVKQLGRRIMEDHTKANRELEAIVSRKGITAGTRPRPHKMSRRDMQNFDQAWLAMMINDHQKSIGAFQQQAQQGGDRDLRNFAKKTVPVLQRHLKMVQQAQQKLGSTATAPAQQQTGTTAKKNR